MSEVFNVIVYDLLLTRESVRDSRCNDDDSDEAEVLSGEDAGTDY